MIEYIRGSLVELNPAAAVVETRDGVAYRLNITLPTFTAIEGCKEVRLYVHEHIREDAWTLYGFAGERERELFRALIGVSGVGAVTAVLILSALNGDELAAVVAAGDSRRLKAIKGIGLKTAERIIIDLRDKLGTQTATAIMATAARNDAFDEALAALQMLGFSRGQSEKALLSIFDAEPDVKVETAIRRALAMIK